MPSPEQIQFTELATWLRQNNHSRRSFGELVSADKMVVSRLVRGKLKRIDPSLVQRISSATNGEIGEREFAAYFARLAA